MLLRFVQVEVLCSSSGFVVSSFQYSNEQSIVVAVVVVVVVGLFYITIFVFFVCFWNTMRIITEAIALLNVTLTPHAASSRFSKI